MAFETYNRLAGADVVTGDDQVLGLERAAAFTDGQQRPDDLGVRIQSLEVAARLAIEAVTDGAEQRISSTLERGESRILDALSLAEQQQREFARWRDDWQGRLEQQVNELNEWDGDLRALSQDLGGMREMAEAAIGVASDELERRWDAIRRELTDILETAASDERARWEAFMLSATETLANSAGIDPAEVDALRIDIAQLRETAAQTIHAAQHRPIASLAIAHDPPSAVAVGPRALPDPKRVELIGAFVIRSGVSAADRCLLWFLCHWCSLLAGCVYGCGYVYGTALRSLQQLFCMQ